MGRVLLATSNGTATAAAGPRFARDGFELNYTRPANNTERPTDRTANLNPGIAIVISAVIIAFFLVGWATGYFKRWIWGSEAENHDGFLRRGRNFVASAKTSQRGLDPETVAALPLVQNADLPSVDDDDEQAGKKYFDCAACLAVFDPTDSLRLLSQCYHAFHSDCIDEWFRSHTTCPLCRACLAHPDPRKALASTQDHDAERRGGMIVEVVIGGESNGASTAILSRIVSPDETNVGAQRANASAQEEEQHQEQVNVRAVVIFSNAQAPSFMRASRMGTSPPKAAVASIRRSSSATTGFQLRQTAGYFVDSEGTPPRNRNFPVHAIATDDHDTTQPAQQSNENLSTTWRLVSLRDHCSASGASSLAFGVISSKVDCQGGTAAGLQQRQHLRSTRWSSFPNLRQIAQL